MRGFWDSAMLLSLLVEEEDAATAAFDYLLGLLDHTEAYREQASWCWLQEHRPILLPWA